MFFIVYELWRPMLRSTCIRACSLLTPVKPPSHPNFLSCFSFFHLYRLFSFRPHFHFRIAPLALIATHSYLKQSFLVHHFSPCYTAHHEPFCPVLPHLVTPISHIELHSKSILFLFSKRPTSTTFFVFLRSTLPLSPAYPILLHSSHTSSCTTNPISSFSANAQPLQRFFFSIYIISLQHLYLLVVFQSFTHACLTIHSFPSHSP